MTMLLITVLLLSVILLLAAEWRSRSADIASQRRFYELLEQKSLDTEEDKSWARMVVRRMGHSKIGRSLPKLEDQEAILLLKQAGWYSLTGRTVYMLAGRMLPLIFTAILLFILLFSQATLVMEDWAKLFIAAGIGYLLPKQVLRRKARLRRSQLAREMPTAIHLLRMLFEAGLSTEHALRVLYQEGTVLTPELSRELNMVLRQIDAGLEPANALAEMAAPLEVNELSDTVAILKQVSLHGGNIRDTLIKFGQLIEERQLSALREYVNTLSGKMSVVMMVFLFPALLIFLAGPGFMALAKGLMGVS